MNSFGRNFRISIFGESHGEALGVVIDGVKEGIELTAEDFAEDLARRRAGTKGTTPRVEKDVPEIVSGVFRDRTTGAPLTILFRNENARSGDYSQFATHPRPSHADWVARQKFSGHNDPRGGGHFSGRLTLGLVAAGVVAKKQLRITTRQSREANYDPAEPRSELRITSQIIETGDIEAALAEKDSVGGIVECVATGVKPGLGEPFFDSVESVAAHLMFAIPGIKGVEFGAGFKSARMRGSEHNDPIIDAAGTTKTNHAGGVVGGISNGNPIIVRVAVKPTASIARPQPTYNTETKKVAPLSIEGRHDACIALRAAVVVEACLAIALCELKIPR